MRLRTKIILPAAAFLCIVSIWFFTRPDNQSTDSQVDAAEKLPDKDSYEFLQALPYVQWSDAKGTERKKSVTLYDRKLASPGYNLYTNDEDEAYLMDMNGNRINTWNLTGKNNCEYAELLKDGSLLVVCANESILKVDWHSKKIWEHDLRVHHDVELLPDGSYLTLLRQKTTYKKLPVVFDSIIRVSPEGEILERWNTEERIQEIGRFHETHPMEIPGEAKFRKKWKKDVRVDYYHMNTIQLLPETELGKRDSRFAAGNLIVCFRNVNLIAILDSKTMKIVWSWGPGEIQLPHMPTMLPNGNILIFDNGSERLFSRVIELEPATGRIVWEYKGKPPRSFFSHWQGSAQRLPNGNTLICESTKAVVFEVTPQGKVVWRFWSPEVQNTRRKRIYRFLRLSPEYVEPILTQMQNRGEFN
jgi:hypothetical protein